MELTMDQDLSTAIGEWKPAPIQARGTLSGWQVAAFAGVLEQPDAPREGDPLPPLWHWFHLLDHPRQSELGEDGHPAEGHFMPPMPERRRMIAGGRLRVRTPLTVGETVTRRSELVSATVKSGRSGQMVFVTVRHEFSRVDGGHVLVTE